MRSGHPQARGHPRRLSRSLSPGRRVAPVLDGADESFLPGGKADYIVTGSWGKKAVKEAQKVGTVAIAGSTESENFTARPATGRIRSSIRRPPTSTSRPTRRFRASSGHGSRNRLRPAGLRRVFGHLQPSDRRVQVRADLRGRAEEPGAGGRHARHSPRGPARAFTQDPRDDARLQHAREGQVALQHAAGLRDLRHAARDEVASRAGRPRGRRQAQRREGEDPLRRDRRLRRLLPARTRSPTAART